MKPYDPREQPVVPDVEEDATSDRLENMRINPEDDSDGQDQTTDDAELPLRARKMWS